MIVPRPRRKVLRRTSPSSHGAAASLPLFVIGGAASLLLLLLFHADSVVLAQSSTTTSATATTASSSTNAWCDLDCQNDTPCVPGAANFDDHPTNVDGTEFDFLRDKEIGNMHCSCPHGLTGVLCDVPYEGCDGSVDHACYNGGRCIPGLEDEYGNEQLFCDCSTAFDDGGNQYVGKFCEIRQDAAYDGNGDASDGVGGEYCDEELTQFCVNGGRCNSQYP